MYREAIEILRKMESREKQTTSYNQRGQTSWKNLVG